MTEKGSWSKPQSRLHFFFRAFYCLLEVIHSFTDYLIFALFQRIRQIGGFVTTSECTLFMLMGDSKHPNFKEVQALVKTAAPDSGLLSKCWWKIKYWMLWQWIIKCLELLGKNVNCRWSATIKYLSGNIKMNFYITFLHAMHAIVHMFNFTACRILVIWRNGPLY